jgi:hypothetical protein
MNVNVRKNEVSPVAMHHTVMLPRYLRGEVNNSIGRVGQWSGRGLLPAQNTYTVIYFKYIIVRNMFV